MLQSPARHWTACRSLIRPRSARTSASTSRCARRGPCGSRPGADGQGHRRRSGQLVLAGRGSGWKRQGAGGYGWWIVGVGQLRRELHERDGTGDPHGASTRRGRRGTRQRRRASPSPPTRASAGSPTTVPRACRRPPTMFGSAPDRARSAPRGELNRQCRTPALPSLPCKARKRAGRRCPRREGGGLSFGARQRQRWKRRRCARWSISASACLATSQCYSLRRYARHGMKRGGGFRRGNASSELLSTS